MFFVSMIVIWIFLIIIWILVSIFVIYQYKKTRYLNLLTANLYFIATKDTQGYFEKNALKLEDWFFEFLESIIDQYKYFYQRKLKLLYVIKTIYPMTGLLVVFFSYFIIFVLEHLSLGYIVGISIFGFFIIILILKTMYLNNDYYTTYRILQIGWALIQNWKRTNDKLSGNNFITLEELKSIYHQKFQNPQKIKIANKSLFRGRFSYQINYQVVVKEIFDTPEKYLYFSAILPYDKIKLNSKKSIIWFL